jgi:hypothetical protein
MVGFLTEIGAAIENCLQSVRFPSAQIFSRFPRLKVGGSLSCGK